jgi:hypothetical protein
MSAKVFNANEKEKRLAIIFFDALETSYNFIETFS